MLKQLFFLWLLSMLSFPVCLVYGQTEAEIEEKYGKSVKVYSVSKHIWMTPEYTDDGLICQMRLYPKRVSADTNYIVHKLPFLELKKVLSELIPQSARGHKSGFFGISLLAGGMATTLFEFENVTFAFETSIASQQKPVKNEKAETPSQEKKPEADDEFPNSFVYNAEIVTIRWKHRKCAKE